MPRVTVVGAGVFGLTIALFLPRHYDVTIVARDMPGDPDSLDWASPWAGAGFGGGGTKPDDPQEMEMLKAAFRYYWNLSESHPESSVKMYTLPFTPLPASSPQIHHPSTASWTRPTCPPPRMPRSGSPTPPSSSRPPPTSPTSPLSFTPSTNVAFVPQTVSDLTDLLPLSPDVLVNAIGVGAGRLDPINDPLVEPVRGQTIVIRQPAIDHMTLRSGIDYCYVIPRGDGTAVIGGIKEHGKT
ncbi:hypothetical protein OE88DRAFT_1740516 [Heliocybe sulcata]|uniref:FAD dependent oxidoreductase domain-containing protein n=1 Tax=Heliocybe sulcata TaxID=5364 RepID=A0A5C3MKJ2_9AGAM|nr:hypothetical protein OE88DRAFT_1740516 [Heliocybe sulcata]